MRNNNLKFIDDFTNLVDKLADSGLDPSLLNSDVDLPRAKNVIDFAIGKDFLGSKLFSKQAEQAVRLFAEWCPECTDKEYIKNVPVSDTMGQFQDHVVLLDKSVCPKCHKNKKELFESVPVELVSCLGQRSGKSALSGGILSTYILHRFLLIQNPARYYGLQDNSMIEITFVALDLNQIEGTLWSYFSGNIGSSPWFKEYNKAIKEKEKKLGVKPGSLCKIMDTYAWYGNKRILCSYRAADMKGLRGATRIVGAVDELGLFSSFTNAVTKSKAIRANATETYTSLDNSLMTLRATCDSLWNKGNYDVLYPYMINIGSPSNQYDKMMTLLKVGETDKRKVCMHLATWEANPAITRESLRSKELSNPVEFWRDFGALPPLSNSPLIGNEKVVYNCKTEKQPIFKTRYKYVDDKTGNGKFIAADVVSCIQDKQTARIITCDAGEKVNHFCISVHHIENKDNEIVLYMDGIVEVAPEYIQEKDDLISVHFPSMFDIVTSLCKQLHVIMVVFDRWNSCGEIQRFKDLSIRADRYSPNIQDFKNFANLVYSGNYRMPCWEYPSLTDLDITNKDAVKKAPYTHAAIQMATVQEIGKKVVKPDFGEDDIFRSIVSASHYALDLTTQKEMLLAGVGTAKIITTNKNTGYCLGVVRGNSGNYGGNTRGGSSNTGMGSVRGASQKY